MNIDTLHYLDEIRAILLPLPGVTEYTCFGTPAFRAGRKLVARMKEDGATLAIYTDERDTWMKADPATFFITDHYRNYPMMLIALATVHAKDLGALLLAAWKMRAGKKMLKEYEERSVN